MRKRKRKLKAKVIGATHLRGDCSRCQLPINLRSAKRSEVNELGVGIGQSSKDGKALLRPAEGKGEIPRNMVGGVKTEPP